MIDFILSITTDNELAKYLLSFMEDERERAAGNYRKQAQDDGGEIHQTSGKANHDG